MKVNIKSFNVQMDVKQTGVEFGIHDNKNNHRGDLVITKANVIWCKGKTPRDKGKKVSWEKFIRHMEEN